MTTAASSKRNVWLVLIVVVLVAGSLSIPAVRNAAVKSLQSLRVQKVQAVNADFSPYVDASANPTLHQMVTQMISDKVQVETNEEDQPVGDVAGARQAAGFNVLLLTARKDTPKLVVSGAHKIAVSVDRTRLQAIATEAGHPDISLPQSLDGATLGVQVPRSVQVQYGTCPTGATAGQVVADNITGPSPTTTQYSDCVRLREGPTPIVNMPSSLDVAGLAQIGLETAGMTPTQASDFLHTVDWRAVLTLSVPRSLRSYQTVKVDGTDGTLLTMAGRRGPGYALVWTKSGIVYTLTGFGDSSQAVGSRRFAEMNGSKPLPGQNHFAVQTQNLRKDFGGKVAVRDLTLTVPRGEIFGFLGPNGAGKSTSIKMLLGLARPTSGEAFVMGEPPGNVEVRRKIGFLPENFRFYEWLTPAELLRLHGRLCGVSSEQACGARSGADRLGGAHAAYRQTVAEFFQGHVAAHWACAGFDP